MNDKPGNDAMTTLFGDTPPLRTITTADVLALQGNTQAKSTYNLHAGKAEALGHALKIVIDTFNAEIAKAEKAMDAAYVEATMAAHVDDVYEGVPLMVEPVVIELGWLLKEGLNPQCGFGALHSRLDHGRAFQPNYPHIFTLNLASRNPQPEALADAHAIVVMPTMQALESLLDPIPHFPHTPKQWARITVDGPYRKALLLHLQGVWYMVPEEERAEDIGYQKADISFHCHPCHNRADALAKAKAWVTGHEVQLSAPVEPPLFAEVREALAALDAAWVGYRGTLQARPVPRVSSYSAAELTAMLQPPPKTPYKRRAFFVA
ncbi:MAG: hypothetical protein WAX89_00795 [Alphaproteobacteria bacterium]